MFFFFNDTATTEIYTLSLHDALPISEAGGRVHPLDLQRLHDLARHRRGAGGAQPPGGRSRRRAARAARSEEHTSELQSRLHLVCRLLLEKKKKRVLT